MYKKMALCCLALALGWQGWGEDLLVKFKDVKLDEHHQLPTEKRGYVLSQGTEGKVVDFQKYEKDKTSGWPYVGVRGNAIKIRDWSKHKYLVIRIRNLSQEISPTVTVVVRDTSGKLNTVPCWVRTNSLNHLVIPVAEFGKKIDLKKINLLQVAMPNSPNRVALELIDASLKGTAGETDPNTMIPRVHDLKKELFDRKEGVSLNGTTELKNSGNDVIVSTKNMCSDTTNGPAYP
jgi:hypothetical protein